jgi:L-asparagine oxygenase
MMPVISAPEAAGLTVDQIDAIEIERMARRLCRAPHDRVDNSAWIAAVRRASCSLPYRFRGALRQFRRDPGSSGSVVMHGLPVDFDRLPPTPAAKGSVQRTFSVPATVLMLAACELGDPIAFRAEKSGALVQDVVPVPGSEEFQGNAGSVLLSFHNENAFHAHRPDFVMLLCLRADHDQVAGLRVASARELVPALSGTAVTALFHPEFVTKPPPSFGGRDDATAPHAVLTGAAEDPDIRLDMAATVALTPRAKMALEEIDEALDRIEHTFRLAPGDLAIVDNRVALHGRTAFRPRYDGRDRWLQRTFVAADLRRSRSLRPSDSHVLMG